MKNGIEILKANNIKVTPQRLGVYNIMSKGDRHYTAEDIFENVKKNFPTISLATVYAILETFKNKQLVQEIRIDFQRSSYDIKKERHHHFQCSGCKKIFDVEMPLCEALHLGEVEGHKIKEFQGYFYGLCRECISAGKRG